MNKAEEKFIERYVPKKYHNAIEEVEIGSEGYWITVKPGYIVTSTDSHTIHEYSVTDVKKQLKYIEVDEDYIDLEEDDTDLAEEKQVVELPSGQLVSREKYMKDLRYHIERTAKRVRVLRAIVEESQKIKHRMSEERKALLESDIKALERAEEKLGRFIRIEKKMKK